MVSAVREWIDENPIPVTGGPQRPGHWRPRYLRRNQDRNSQVPLARLAKLLHNAVNARESAWLCSSTPTSKLPTWFN